MTDATPTEPTTTTPTTPTPTVLNDNEKVVKKQIEFYFSDANFRRDAFLRGRAQTNVEGWVEIATLLTFKRLQSMTTDAAVVAKSVVDSTTVVVSEDKTKLRRSTALPSKDDTKYRTMFAQLIPTDATLEELRETFGSAPDCTVELVRMRRDKNTKEFVGSAFVEYTTQSMLRAALQHEFVSKGAALNTCALEEFLFAAKERRDAEKNSSSSGYGDAAKTNKADKRPFEAEVKVEFTKGLILKLTKHAELLDREKIREVLNAHGTVAFIDYARNQEEGFVRMEDADSAKAALSAMNSTSKTEEVVAEGAEGAKGAEGAEGAEGAKDAATENREVAKVEEEASAAAPADTAALFSIAALEGDAEEAYWRRIKSNQKALYKSRGGGGHKNKRGRRN
jgi:hypothetical protein